MIKRALSSILDLIFIVNQLVIILLISLFFLNLIFIKGNPETINTVLSSKLTVLGILVYIVSFVVFFINQVVIPQKFQQTIAMGLLGLSYSPQASVDLITLIKQNIIGNFWAILVFPIGIIVFLFKGESVNALISRFKIINSTSKGTKIIKMLAIINLLLLIPTIGLGILVYTKGPNFIVDRLIDYQQQTELYIKQAHWDEAEYALNKYQTKKGADATYDYLACQVYTNKKDYEKGETSCQKALASATDNTQKQSILLLQAQLYRDQNKDEESLTVYHQLWQNYNYRALDILVYASLLDDQNKTDEAITIIQGIEQANNSLNKEESYTIKRLYADLLLKQSKYAQARAVYQELYQMVNEDQVNFATLSLDKQEVTADLEYLIGKCYYFEKKYTEALDYFKKAKENNTNYTDLVESYIIDIGLKKK